MAQRQQRERRRAHGHQARPGGALGCRAGPRVCEARTALWLLPWCHLRLITSPRLTLPSPRLTLLALLVSTISFPILAGLAAQGLDAPIQSDDKRASQRKADAAARQRNITGEAPPKQQASKCSICHVTGHTKANKDFHP